MKMPIILDNTLPQSAEAWCRGVTPESSLGESAFIAFANAVICNDGLYVPVPATVAGSSSDDSFVRLTQSMGAIVSGSGKEWRAQHNEEFLTNFVNALAVDDQAWAEWLVIQSSRQITDQFTARVGSWKSELQECVKFLDPVIQSNKTSTNHPSVAKVIGALEKMLGGNYSIDSRYGVHALSLNVSPKTLLISYAYNWALRGRSYGISLVDKQASIGFHPLRNLTSSTPSDSVLDENVTSDFGLNWGAVIAAQVRDGLLPRSPEKLAGLFKELRGIIRKNHEYLKQISLAERGKGSREEELEHQCRAATLALSEAGYPLDFLDSDETFRLRARRLIFGKNSTIRVPDGALEPTTTLLLNALMRVVLVAAPGSEASRRHDIRWRVGNNAALWHIYQKPSLV